MTREYIFSGHVQGVGFRYRAAMLARQHDVTGFVRNLANGTVQLVASGTEAQLDSLIKSLSEFMADHIDHVDSHPLEATESFGSFEIRY